MMSKYLLKGTYSYKVQKIVMADSKEDAFRMWEACDVEPLCEWEEDQEQYAYEEEIDSIEELEEVNDE